MRHGDPLAGRTPDGEPLAFLEVALKRDSNACVLWPYNKNDNGYGQLRVEGKQRRAHRFVCERVRGPAPTSEHEASHSCGVRACINPNHLSWKTPSGNMQDKYRHGTHNRGERHNLAKVTEANAREILFLKGKLPQRQIAQLFGVSRAIVSNIHTGRNWGWLAIDDRRAAR